MLSSKTNKEIPACNSLLFFDLFESDLPYLILPKLCRNLGLSP
jgi:hypothetical protein